MAYFILKNFVLLAILFVGIFSIGLISIAEAHPHSTIDLMDTHSHDLYTAEDFVIHTFEQVILLVNQLQNIIFN